ncbi:hypothetical protein, partial [Spiroplasma sp. ChiS]|uniref:hypothetical protein n=1 Tax=Spiroplasma sp. ChiS TaxID=2099885 RepID=UPI001F2AFD30
WISCCISAVSALFNLKPYIAIFLSLFANTPQLNNAINSSIEYVLPAFRLPAKLISSAIYSVFFNKLTKQYQHYLI